MAIDLSTATQSIEEKPIDENIERNWDKDKRTAEKEDTHLDGLKAFYRLRKKWSWFIDCEF